MSTERYKYYSDGVTKITDPFWVYKCICGHEFMSCVSVSKCPKCGSLDSDKRLGNKTFSEVVAERGEPHWNLDFHNDNNDWEE